jgi:diaminopimelate dehydrogenase
MEKIKVAIVGYGNIGKFSVEAVQEATDMELVGVVRRSSSVGNTPIELSNTKIVSNIEELGKVDVAILCGPTRSIPETALSILKKGICTVDSFDIHGQELVNLRQSLAEEAKKNNVGGEIICEVW